MLGAFSGLPWILLPKQGRLHGGTAVPTGTQFATRLVGLQSVIGQASEKVPRSTPLLPLAQLEGSMSGVQREEGGLGREGPCRGPARAKLD